MPDFKPEDIYKIMLVGDSEVGKSQLARCYHHKDTKLGPHAPSQAIYYQTGVEKVRSSSNSSAGGVKKQLWVFDTAGKTKHQNLVSSFYPGIHGFLLVFDLMEEASFVSVREKWAKLVRAKSNDHAKFFLIGNKLDCDEYREVDNQRAKDFAEVGKKISAGQA